MPALASELRRLHRAQGARHAQDRARRAHLLVLGAAVVLAFVSRAVHALPGLGRLEGRLVPSIIGGLLLLALGYLLPRLLRQAARLWSKPGLAGIAAALDDAHGWRDETSTAAGLPETAAGGVVPQLLLAQTAGRLRTLTVDAPVRWSPVAWPRVLLAALFVFLLIAPGVNGLLGLRGAGQGDGKGLGQSPNAASVGEQAPIAADLFLTLFARDPLPVEPLEADPADAAAKDAAAKDASPDGSGGTPPAKGAR
jgi:hypothetical protein